jgi:hypothetical protein
MNFPSRSAEPVLSSGGEFSNSFLKKNLSGYLIQDVINYSNRLNLTGFVC